MVEDCGAGDVPMREVRAGWEPEVFVFSGEAVEGLEDQGEGLRERGPARGC